MGRAARGRDRDAGLRQPALRARRACACCAEGCGAGEVVARLTAADEDRDHRQLGVVDGARRQRDATPARRASTGRAASPARASPRRGTSSSRDETVEALAASFADTWRPAARRAAARRARRGAGRRRRPARPAVGRAARRRARRRLRGPVGRASSTCASTTTTQPIAELRRLYGMHELLFGKTPPERVARRRRRARSGAARAPGRLGYEGELERRVRPLGRHREPRGARRRRRAHRPGRARGAAPAMRKRLGGASRRRARRDPGRRGRRLAAGAAPARHRVRSASTPTRARAPASTSSRSTTRPAAAPAGTRRCTSSCAAARRSRSTARRSTPRPGTLVFIRDPALRRVAIAEEAGTVVLAVGGEPGRAVRGLAVGVHASRRSRSLEGRALGRGDRADARRACASTRGTRRCSTTSRAPSRWPAGRSTRSRTSARRSRREPDVRRRARAATRTSTRSGGEPGFRSSQMPRLRRRAARCA